MYNIQVHVPYEKQQYIKKIKNKYIIIIIIILIKCYSLTRLKLTALYKHLITKTTLTYISANKTLIIVALITITGFAQSLKVFESLGKVG